VVSGGISDNYNTTLSFIDDIGKQLERQKIKFRFIPGNTDYYYTISDTDSVVDKEKKFREIQSLYLTSHYSLVTHPVITRNVRLVGLDTWYDYSLYRGKPRDFKDIAKKSYLFLRNRDNDYITSSSDYLMGVSNVFDTRYTKECIDLMISKLDFYRRKHGACANNIVVTYFKTSKAFLGNSPVEKYMGAFEGSSRYHEVFRRYGVTTCIFGKSSKVRNATLDSIKYINSNRKMEVLNFD
jgi:hypothetical protein